MGTTKIAVKWLNILSTLKGVPKKGYNSHQNYHYIRESDIVDSIKDAILEQKVILRTDTKLLRMDPVEKTRKDGSKATEFITTVEAVLTLSDTESGEELVFTSIGSGIDTGDKGVFKAVTGAVKYGLMKNFLMSDEGADPENDGVSDQGATHTSPTVKAPKSFAAPKSFGTVAAKVEPVQVTPTVAPSLTFGATAQRFNVKVSGPTETGATVTEVIATQPVVNSTPSVTVKPSFKQRQAEKAAEGKTNAS